MVPAFANISGDIEENNVGEPNAFATFERIGEYWFDETDGNGDYTTTQTSSGGFYHIDGYKKDHTRDSTTAFDGTTPSDLDINSRSDNNVLILVVYDDDTNVTASEAIAEVKASENLLRDQHSIDYVTSTTSTSVQFDSTGETTCDDHLKDARDEANWTTGNFGSWDVMIAITDNGFSDTGGACMRSYDATNVPDEDGQHPYIVIDMDGTHFDTEHLGMHEMTHAFGIDHTNASCSSQIPGIMAVNAANTQSCTEQITNWIPSNDDDMESNRLWY